MTEIQIIIRYLIEIYDSNYSIISTNEIINKTKFIRFFYP